MHYGNEDKGMLAIYLKKLWGMLTVSSTPSGYCAHWLHEIKLGAHLEKANGGLRYTDLIDWPHFPFPNFVFS